MVKSHYKNVFNIPWGETWYASVIEPLVLSADKNEELRKESENKIPVYTDNEWQPYELIIETQVGLVLVLCQSYITNVASQIGNFHNDYKSLFNEELLGFNISRRSLIGAFSSKYKDTTYTEVEAIEHFANYFKHHEEWKGKDDLLKNNAKRTADAVHELGLDIHQSLWYSRNLSKAVKFLGVENLHQLPNLLLIIDKWKSEIGRSYQENGVLDV